MLAGTPFKINNRNKEYYSQCHRCYRVLMLSLIFMRLRVTRSKCTRFLLSGDAGPWRKKKKRKNTMSLNEFNIFCIFHLHQVFLIVDVFITSFSIRCWNPALQNLLFRLCYCRNTSQQQCKNEQQQSERLLLLFLQQLRQMLIWFSGKKNKREGFLVCLGLKRKYIHWQWMQADVLLECGHV